MELDFGFTPRELATSRLRQRLCEMTAEQRQSYKHAIWKLWEDVQRKIEEDAGQTVFKLAAQAREGRQWGKIREETYAIKLLADHKGYSDAATFRLKPYAFPGTDADLTAGNEQFALQITIADPIWDPDGKVQHGGYDHHLLMEALNRQGVVHGTGNFRRDGDKIVCDEPVKNGSDGADACRRGIVAALVKKSKPTMQPGSRLLIYTRAHTMQVVDEGYGNVVAAAVKEFEASSGVHSIPFAKVYFVDERQFAEL